VPSQAQAAEPDDYPDTQAEATEAPAVLEPVPDSVEGMEPPVDHDVEPPEDSYPPEEPRDTQDDSASIRQSADETGREEFRAPPPAAESQVEEARPAAPQQRRGQWQDRRGGQRQESRGQRPQHREEPPRPPAHPASPASVSAAIEEVTGIIEDLKQIVDELEEVLETLEVAERQKTADEQEIENLRRLLRQFQRPREGGFSGQSRGPSR
jgi:hypothetical protein